MVQIKKSKKQLFQFGGWIEEHKSFKKIAKALKHVKKMQEVPLVPSNSRADRGVKS